MSERTRLAAGLAAVALSAAVGLALRFADFDWQILGGDELHAVHFATTRGWGEVLTYYGPEDDSVPLTRLYAKGLAARGALSELTLRLPVAASGVLLILAPLAFAPALGWPAALGAAALSATSPPMIFYSIFARSYAPAALALVLALAAWQRWLAGGARRAHLAFAALAALAVSLHLFCAFPAGALFALALARSRGEPSLRRPLAAALALAAAIGLALLGPGLGLLAATHRLKLGGTTLEGVALAFPWAQLTGGGFALEAAFAVLGALGLAALWRRAPPLAHGMAAMLAAQALALAILRPAGGPGSFGRYFFLVWPLWLLATAAGLEAAVRAIARRLAGREPAPGAALSATLLTCAGLALAVPAVSPAAIFRVRPSSLRSGKAMLHPERAFSRAAPALGRWLAAQPDRGDVLLVAPYVTSNESWIALAGLQARLGMRIEMAEPRIGAWRRRGVALRHVVDLDEDDQVRATGARYLLLAAGEDPPGLREQLRARLGGPVALGQDFEVYRLPPTSPAAD
jgi:hypothetical protein